MGFLRTHGVRHIGTRDSCHEASGGRHLFQQLLLALLAQPPLVDGESGDNRQQADNAPADQEVPGGQTSGERQLLRTSAHIHERGAVVLVGGRRRIVPGRGRDNGIHALHLVPLDAESQIPYVRRVRKRGVRTGNLRHLVHVGTRLGEAELAETDCGEIAGFW